MSFKIGDKVMEIKTGDIGVVSDIRPNSFTESAHYVEWETGVSSGENLWIRPEEIKLFEQTKVSDLSGEKIVIAGVTYILMRNADNV